MIHILLLILKIIGIVLLAALAIILLILFFPVTYSVNARFEKNRVDGRLMAGWFFHIIHFVLKFKGDSIIYKLRVFGIPIYSSDKKEKHGSEEKADDRKKDESNKAARKSETKADNENSDSKYSAIEDNDYRESYRYEAGSDEHVKNDDGQGNTEKKSGKIWSFVEKIKNALKIISYNVKKLFRNAKEVHTKIDEIKKFIRANSTKEAFNYGKTLVIKLLKHIFPRKIRANIQMGFDEPHITGQMLGYIAMAYGTFGINPEHIVIDPYFDKKILQGHIRLRGRFVIGIVIYYALRFYFKKEIHDIIKKFS